jgi:predicted O-linked N-acetylglucosamine transferase (SPINDLY family)
LGIALAEQGCVEEAIAAYRRALELDPNSAASRNNLGNALNSLGRFGEALIQFQRALEMKPDYPEAHNNLGNVLRGLGRFDEAMAAYRQAIHFNPQFAKAHNNLGAARMECGQTREAIASCRRALEIAPDYPEAWNNLGNALRDLGQLEEASASFRQALHLRPDFAEASNNLGVVLADQGKFDEAEAACRRAIEIRTDYLEAYNSLGNLLGSRGRLADAETAYRRALALNPHYAEAHGNLGAVLAQLGRLDEARAVLQQALELEPGAPSAHCNLANVLKDQGCIDEAVAAFRRSHELAPRNPEAHSNLIYALLLQPGVDEDVIAEECARWNREFVQPLLHGIAACPNDRDPDRRLRIGYVSPDLREHVVGRNVLPLFKHLDRQTFEIICYSGAINPDSLTAEFRRRSDVWRETIGLSNDAVAAMIRADAIDILVDLSQHTASNRLPIFARRPAPVQVSFAGYPAPTGLETIEYRISDKWLEGDFRLPIADCRLRESSARSKMTETSARHPYPDDGHERVYLLDSFWCYDPLGVDLGPGELPADLHGRITFGCLHNFCKVNGPQLKLWARVLAEVENSRLVLLTVPGRHRQRTVEFLAREGVAPERVEFVDPRPRREYLELYRRLDIVLDTFPYNGHTTALDALWMGVPIVSLAGHTRVSRGGLSMLTNLGLPELAARSEEEYLAAAVHLARDLPRLREWRSTLRARLECSVLMDAPRFALQIEAAYRTMWREWCSGRASA